MSKIWSIPGGIHPPENKTQSTQHNIGTIPLPSELVFPLNQHIGAPAQPVVNVGDQVLAGQVIARSNKSISAPVHASTSGTIVAIEDRPVAHPSGMNNTCIVLRADGKDTSTEFIPCVDYTQLSPPQLLGKIRDAGIVGLGGAGFPAAVKLNPPVNHTIDTLIINATECEPYITADDLLMQTYAEEIVAGIELLAYVLGNPTQVLVGIEDNKPKAIAALEKAAQNTAIAVRPFPTKYPSGGEKQLIQILTGRELPHGKLPADIGVVSHNVGTVRAVWRAVRFGEPLISRVTTVVGESLQVQRNIEVLLGTPIEHVLAAHGFNAENCSRLVMGGPMMGFALQTAAVPVVKTTNCILAPTEQELPHPPPAQACIRCGNCADVCPARLLPQQLFWYAQAQDYEKLQTHNLFDCIECGACSYVCPSNIALVQYYRASKDTMRHMAAEKEKSDHSRQRFEFHQQRIARAEAEKAAKRKARKEAAQEAKKKLAAAKEGDGASVATEQAEIVAQALERVKTKLALPEQQQDKLQRAVASAKNRLQRAQARLEQAGGSDQADSREARVKEAQLRLQDAEQRLAELMTSNAKTKNAKTKNAKTKINTTADAADTAIEKAKAKAAAQASMTPEEKRRSQITSLQGRLEKARARLQQAEHENGENIDTLRLSVDKLEAKLAQINHTSSQ